jgi:hypothetical protein
VASYLQLEVVKTSKINGMTVYYAQKWVSQRKVHEWLDNSKCEGKQMLLLLLLLLLLSHILGTCCL